MNWRETAIVVSLALGAAGCATPATSAQATVPIAAASTPVAGAIAQGASQPPGSPGSTPVASATPNAATPGVASTSATDDGLQMSIRQEGSVTSPGGTLALDVTVHNGRTSDVVYSVTCGSATTMTTTLPCRSSHPAGTGPDSRVA